MTLSPVSAVHTKPSLSEMHFHFDVLEAFVIGTIFGSVLAYLYFTRDKRVANSVRDLISFTEGYDRLITMYGHEPKFFDEHLAYEYKNARLICRKHYLPFNAYLLAAQIVVSSKLGSQDTLDAVKACWRVKMAAEKAIISDRPTT